MKGETIPNGPIWETYLKKASDELRDLPKWRWLRRRHLHQVRYGILESIRLAYVKRDGGHFEPDPSSPVFDGPDEVVE